MSINENRIDALRARPEFCAHCGLDVAAHRVERNGVAYCRDFCARQAQPVGNEARQGRATS